MKIYFEVYSQSSGSGQHQVLEENRADDGPGSTVDAEVNTIHYDNYADEWDSLPFPNSRLASLWKITIYKNSTVQW